MLRLCLLATFLCAPFAASAAEPPASYEPRVPGGKCLSEAGKLLFRTGPGKTWQVAGPKEELFTRDLLLALPGEQAEVEVRPETVKLTLWGNLPALSPFPGFESAVVLHDSRAFDLDFTLVRGRVVIVSQKPKGDVKVWVRLPGDTVQLTLAPGTEVALEQYSKWSRGTSFASDPRKQGEPTTMTQVFVLKGQVELKCAGSNYTLVPPPGKASFTWDNVDGPDLGPAAQEKLPAWADPKHTPTQKEQDQRHTVRAQLERFRKGVKSQAPEDAVSDNFQSANRSSNTDEQALIREMAAACLAALDEPGALSRRLAEEKDPAARDACVMALRHWVADSGTRPRALADLLVNNRGYTRAHAGAVVELLMSPFSPVQPETYETLIAYLGHDHQDVRELARWHLHRFAPTGRAIKYDAAAPKEDRQKAVDEWKKLIPSGKLPPDPPKPEKP